MGLFDIFSDKPAKDAAAALTAGYQTGKTDANNQLTAGQTSADALYGKAYSPFEQLFASTGKGADAYADATGVNGADGLARAKAIYQANPGYSGGLNTGIDQVMRTAAARGDLGGGNTSADTIKFASDYDNQQYSNYVNSLAPYLGAQQGAASGGASVLGSQAGSDLGVSSQIANNNYNAATGIGNANAQADLAKYSASSNFWNALMGIGSLGLKASGIGGFAPTTKAA